MSPRNLVDKSVTNIFWSYLSFFSTKALNLIAIIIVARYLSPAEFGLMAFGLVVIGYFELVQGFGLGAYLISTRHALQEAAEAVFGFAVTVSAAMLAAIWVSADMIAGYFGQPDLADILQFLSVALLIESFAAVHSALLQRELKFRLKIMPDVARGLVKGFLSIGLAVAGYGVWALAWGYVIGTLAWTLTLIMVRPWRRRSLPKLRVLWPALRDGSNILLGGLCNAVPRTLDSLMVGKVLGAEALGLYSVSLRMPQLAIKTFGIEASKVVHPVISEMQGATTAVRGYYYGLVRYLALLMFPLGAALAAMTEPLIRLLYTPEWLGVVAPMQILSIAFALSTINMLPGTLYKAINRSDYFLLTSAIGVPAFVAVMWVAVPLGVEAVALGHAVLVFLNYVPNFLILRRAVGVEAWPTIRATLPGLACAVAAGLVGLGAQQFAPGWVLGKLLLAGAGALAAYLIMLRLLAPEIFTEMRRLIGRKIKKGRRPPAAREPAE